MSEDVEATEARLAEIEMEVRNGLERGADALAHDFYVASEDEYWGALFIPAEEALDRLLSLVRELQAENNQVPSLRSLLTLAIQRADAAESREKELRGALERIAGLSNMSTDGAVLARAALAKARGDTP